MNKSIALLAASMIFASGTAVAAGDHGSKPPATASASEMVDGEVRKIDIDNKKITVKHGEIKNLQMPGMTMVFQVKDPAMLGQVKVGDKIMFAAEKAGGAIVITSMQPAK
ncbi:MAG: copper-binding protein [Caldimonas sp.]